MDIAEYLKKRSVTELASISSFCLKLIDAKSASVKLAPIDMPFGTNKCSCPFGQEHRNAMRKACEYVKALYKAQGISEFERGRKIEEAFIRECASVFPTSKESQTDGDFLFIANDKLYRGEIKSGGKRLRCGASYKTLNRWYMFVRLDFDWNFIDVSVAYITRKDTTADVNRSGRCNFTMSEIAKHAKTL